MPTPEFVLRLREKIGHDQLWLPGVSVVVVDDAGRVLLGRRSDTGRWSIIDGIPEPGEQPAAAAARECEEEAGVRPEILAVVAVETEQPTVYPNGDRCVFLDIGFVARVGAERAAAAGVGDGELTAVAWFAPDALPAPLTPHASARISAARAWLADPTTPARFDWQPARSRKSAARRNVGTAEQRRGAAFGRRAQERGWRSAHSLGLTRTPV